MTAARHCRRLLHVGPGKGLRVSAPYCRPLCQSGGSGSGITGFTGSGGSSGSGSCAALALTGQFRRIFLPRGSRVGPLTAAHRPPSSLCVSAAVNPSDCTTLFTRKLWLPKSALGGIACGPAPDCARMPCGPPPPPLIFVCCGVTWTVPQNLCLSIEPDACPQFAARAVSLGPITNFNCGLALCTCGYGWATGGSAAAPPTDGVSAIAAAPCTAGVGENFECATICLLTLRVGVCGDYLSSDGNACDFNFTNCTFSVGWTQVLSWSPFLVVFRAYLPPACCPGATLAQRAVTVTLTEGPC